MSPVLYLLSFIAGILLIVGPLALCIVSASGALIVWDSSVSLAGPLPYIASAGFVGLCLVSIYLEMYVLAVVTE